MEQQRTVFFRTVLPPFDVPALDTMGVVAVIFEVARAHAAPAPRGRLSEVLVVPPLCQKRADKARDNKQKGEDHPEHKTRIHELRVNESLVKEDARR